MSLVQPILIEIPVSGGQGELAISRHGVVMAVGVIPPDDAAQFDIGGYDCDGFMIYYGDDLVGKSTMAARAQVYDRHLIKITEATHDGTYKVKLWWES